MSVCLLSSCIRHFAFNELLRMCFPSGLSEKQHAYTCIHTHTNTHRQTRAQAALMYVCIYAVSIMQQTFVRLLNIYTCMVVVIMTATCVEIAFCMAMRAVCMCQRVRVDSVFVCECYVCDFFLHYLIADLTDICACVCGAVFEL